MKAVVLTAYGDVDKLVLRDVPDPKPGPSEVKVKVAASSINPVDWKLRSGALARSAHFMEHLAGALSIRLLPGGTVAIARSAT